MIELVVLWIVIDNSCMLLNLEGVIIFWNRNLGGLGGFVCVIIEVKNMDVMYVIFMDDDVICFFEVIRWMLSLLWYVNNWNIVVVGVMVLDFRLDEIWENGVMFDKCCCFCVYWFRLLNFGVVYGMLGC